MRITLLLPLLVSCSLLVACNSDESAPAGASSDSTTKPAATESARALSSACQLLGSDDIRTRFNIDAATEVKMDEGGGAFPSCSWEWGTDVVVRTIRAGGRDIQVGEPAKVMLVVARGVGPEGFQTSTSVYKDAQDVPGIGEQARWGATMSQLSVLSRGTLAHIHVKADSDPETNRQHAIELARIVLQKL